MVSKASCGYLLTTAYWYQFWQSSHVMLCAFECNATDSAAVVVVVVVATATLVRSSQPGQHTTRSRTYTRQPHASTTPSGYCRCGERN